MIGVILIMLTSVLPTDSGKIITDSTPDTGINLSLVFGLEALFFLSLGAFALNKAKKMSK